MPFGKYNTFDDCVSDQLKDHSEEEAKRICGALQRDLEGSIARDTPDQQSKAIPYQTDNGRVYLRVFLLDGSVNLNGWGVDSNSIRQNINTAIGKPLVMYKNAKGEFDHPSLAEHDYNHALQYQDLFRVGTYIDVVESQQHPNRWFGIAEITDEDMKRGIREDPTIPFYVSPTIRLLHPYQSDQSIRDWELFHTALVSEPAYGTQKTLISGQCSGDQNTCLLQLRKASISKNGGKVGCGFCTYEATKEIQEKVSQNISSLETNGLQLQNRNKVMANDNNSNSSEVNTNNNQQQQPNSQVTQQVEQQKETTKVTKQNKPVAGSGNEGNNKEEEQQKQKGEQEGEGTQQKEASTQELFDRNERLSRKNKELELQLQQARADVEGYKTLNAQFNDRLASLEKERDEERRIARVNDITSYVKSAAAFKLLSPAEKDKQIETYVNSSMPLDVIKSQTELLNASFQKASMGAFASASYTPRLQLGGNNSKSVVETRSASTSNSNDNNDRLPASLRLHKMYGSSDGGIQ